MRRLLTPGRILGLALSSSLAAAVPAAESPYLYGIHDHDPSPQEFLDRVRNAGVASSWITATVAIGSRPDDAGGGDFTAFANQGHAVIVRLNNDYCPNGTIPPPDKYADFARRAGNYVAATQGAEHFVIGNETNLSWEWPVVGGRQAYVSPQSYAQVYRLAYSEIKARRPQAKVLVQALAPFAGPYAAGVSCNPAIPADAQPLNWVQYMSEMLTAIKQTGPIDGIALHINSRGYAYGNIHSPQRVDAGGQSLSFSFYVYKDWVELGIPSDLYHLPLYATEANGVYFWKGGHPENPSSHYEPGWVQEVYAEINRYNQQAAASGKPVFRAVNLYRWCNWCDGWNIDSSNQHPNPYKGQILSDLDQAVAARYRWPTGGTPPPTPSGTNLARAAVAWQASSSFNASFGGDKAYDGVVSASSKWTSNGSGPESWLALDLGGSKDVSGFIVRHAGAAGEQRGFNTQALRLEAGSSLTGPWTVLATVSNAAQDDTSTVVLAAAATTRYVRLYVTDAGIDNYARIPELEVYGTAGAPPPGPGALVNGNFESSTPGSAVGTGWTSFASAGYAPGFAVASDQVHGGSLAQRVTSPPPTANDRYAGVYQVVATTAGQPYTVRAWSRTRFTGGNAWDHIARLGIDLTGGTSFQASSVQWHEFDSAKDVWHQLERSATATGSAVTIFLQAWRKWPAGGDSLSWFDDVEVVAGPPPANRPPTAVASASPTTGVAPLAVAFSGSGSSDPDGDPLAYSWSFGDGSQGSGVSVSHTYSAAGSYTATLTVSDGRGGSHSATVAITAVASPGSLVNGNFESSTPGGAVGAGWTSFASTGYAASFAVVSDLAHAGSFAQRVTSPQPTSNDRYAGVYQVVPTTSGQQSMVRAWNRTRFTGGNAWDHIARLGIDLTGGTNFQAASVQWHEFDSAKEVWHQLERSVTATGSSMTIFLQSWRKWPAGGDSFSWFDDVEIVASQPPANRPPTAVASANPTTGVAPLAVAFSGGGSSDPDGDPLTYAWSFGDGAQGSGVSVSHTYSTAGTYTATLTVSDGRGGSHSASLAIAVTTVGGNHPPHAAISATPRWGTMPLTVTLDGRGSSDPDGDPLSYTWSFGDGGQATGPAVTHTYPENGRYTVALTVADGHGGTHSATVRIGVFPPGCPSFLDFDTLREQLDAQGQDLAFVEIGFHAGPGGNHNGIGQWMQCLDAAGVPMFLKSVDDAGKILQAAQLRAVSSVPHTLVYRKTGRAADGYEYDVPRYGLSPYDAAAEHWRRHLAVFPPELLPYKHLIWLETINEVDKGRSEWLGEFAFHTAQLALGDGFNWAAFGWSSGEPEPEHWQGPWMTQFLGLAADNPERIAIALHEYSYAASSLKHGLYEAPALVGRFQWLFDVTDGLGLARPTVVITEFGWEATNVPSVETAFDRDGQPEVDNLPWAAELYAQHPRVKGAAIWYLGAGYGGIANKAQLLIAPLTAYALQNYFAVPRAGGGPSCPNGAVPTADDRWRLEIWNNRQMSGPPVEQRHEAPGNASFAHSWGAGGPSQCAGTDDFAVRFSRRVYFDAGATYTFRTTTDDGVRLFIDGALVLDKWQDQSPTTHQASRFVAAGWHDLRMDYYENAGGALAELSWAAASTPCAGGVPAGSWKGEYFAGRTPSGSPVMVRDDGNGSLAFDWGAGSPSVTCGVPADGFSASWTRTAAFGAGTHRFSATVDDGVRLYIDGVLRLDRWLDQAPTTYEIDLDLAAGDHTIRMEYYENGGGAVARLSWTALAAVSRASSPFRTTRLAEGSTQP